MRGGGGGRGSGWGGGRPWGGGGWGGGMGPAGPPDGYPPPMMPPYGPMMVPPMMATGAQEIVGAEEIVGWVPPPPIEEHHHHHHHHHHHPPDTHGAGFLPDYEMGYGPPGYSAGFLPDYEMGFAPLQPGDTIQYLQDRRGLPMQGYELGAYPQPYATGFNFGHFVTNAVRDVAEATPIGLGVRLAEDLTHQHDPNAWQQHAAWRGWDRGHDWHGGAPLPPPPPGGGGWPGGGRPLPPVPDRWQERHAWEHRDHRW